MIARRLSAVLLFALGSCATPAPPPAPQPRATAPPPRPAPPPVVAAGPDWRDWPLTPGDWVYDRESDFAGFGAPGRRFVIQCLPDRQIKLFLPAGAPGVMTIRTSSISRTLTVDVVGHPIMGSAVTLPANDSLLDAMGYSRGRFVVEPPNAQPMVIPAWAEILRVAEDCRG